jgi:ketosteroid isomerase-like protein
MDPRELIGQMYKELSAGRVEVLDSVMAPEVVIHNAPAPPDDKGSALERAGAFYRQLHEAFSDLSFEVEATVVEGDLVAERTTMRGTHTGELLGLQPTKTQVELTTVAMSRFEGDKLVERWGALGGWA